MKFKTEIVPIKKVEAVPPINIKQQKKYKKIQYDMIMNALTSFF